jgi:NitT/TauT family transport system substrate-binding protein
MVFVHPCCHLYHKFLFVAVGKTVGLDKSSTSYFFFLTAIEKAGVAEDALTIHEMGASDAGAAFVAGRLEAAVSWEPWLSKASGREGGHVLVSSKDFPRTIVDVFVMAMLWSGFSG